MYKKILLISSIALVCSCTDLDRTRTILEYTKPKEDTKSYVCMKECQRLKDKCDNFTMSDTAIIGEDMNGNVCTSDYAKCLQDCGIDVKVIEKKVDLFGFPEKTTTAYSSILTPTSKSSGSSKTAAQTKTLNRSSSAKTKTRISRADNTSTKVNTLEPSLHKDAEKQVAKNNDARADKTKEVESQQTEDKHSHSNSFFKYEFNINKRKRLDQF